MSIFIGGGLLGPGAAQISSPDAIPVNRVRDEKYLDLVRTELILQQVESQRAQMEMAERRQAQYLERQFIEKAKRFVELWEDLAKGYNEKRAFDIKKAKQLSKAFHELEESEGWPKPVRK